jgi:FdhD protein
MDGSRRGQTRARVRVVEGGNVRLQRDALAIEEPLEMRIRHRGATYTAAVTMRTPTADFELAAGFLFGEGLIAGRADIETISYCVGNDACDGEQQYNMVTVELRPQVTLDPQRFDRSFAITSACGVCGKASLDQIERRGIEPLPTGPIVSDRTLTTLPDKLRTAQGLFSTTGGLHAAGLFSSDGDLIAVREDVGRHNAVDKVVGWALLNGKLPLSDAIVLVSGRSSFEIAQKCAAAGAPILCSVSAPSSLAVDLARRFDMTLIGFLRGDRFNVYHDADRVHIGAE